MGTYDQEAATCMHMIRNIKKILLVTFDFEKSQLLFDEAQILNSNLSKNNPTQVNEADVIHI